MWLLVKNIINIKQTVDEDKKRIARSELVTHFISFCYYHVERGVVICMLQYNVYIFFVLI